MGYRKIQADKLFDGETLFEGPSAGVLICTESGQVEGIVSNEDAGEDVQVLEGLLCPGFVNAHCHLELSHMAGLIPTATGMVDFLLQVMGRRDEGPLNPVDAAREADKCMWAEGIVAVGDISNNISTLPLKAGSPIIYHSFVEVAGFHPSMAGARAGQAMQVYNAMLKVFGEKRVSLVPHAPYSVSRPLFDLLNRPGTMTIHNQESPEENEFYRTGRGEFVRLYQTLGLGLEYFLPSQKSSLETYLPWLSAPSSILLVHNTATTEEDLLSSMALSRSREQELYWCLCPGANQYIRRALPPVPLLRKHGCTITLGTDSLASNHRLSMISEIHILQDHFPEVPLAEILRWATLNGAQALGLQEEFGSFARGTRPGVLLVATDEGGKKLSRGARVKRLI